MTKTLAAALAIVPLLAGHPANARDRRQIVAPVFARYSSIWSAKRSLLKAAKKHKALSGGEYYTLAETCQMDEPDSPSIILTLIHKADCKDKVPDFFVAAGDRGVPEGYVDAAKHIGDPARALLFADIGYLVSSSDPTLQAEADQEIGALAAHLPQGRAQAKQIDVAATQYAQQRVAGHVYPSLADLAKRPSANLPNLAKLLNFADARTCTWSDAADDVFGNIVALDSRDRPRPATVRVPGIAKPVRSKVTPIPGGDPRAVEARLDFKGQWLGLTVLGLSNSFVPDTDNFELAIRFAEPVSVVALTLRRAGFPVDPTGKEHDEVVNVPDGSGEQVEVYTSVDPISRSSGAEFSCDATG